MTKRTRRLLAYAPSKSYIFEFVKNNKCRSALYYQILYNTSEDMICNKKIILDSKEIFLALFYNM